LCDACWTYIGTFVTSIGIFIFLFNFKTSLIINLLFLYYFIIVKEFYYISSFLHDNIKYIKYRQKLDKFKIFLLECCALCQTAITAMSDCYVRQL